MREELNILDDFPPTPHDEWLAAVEKQLKGKPFEKALVKKTYEGIGIQPMYFKHDLEGLPQAEAMPGFMSYIRGNKASGNRSEPWRVAQEITEPDPEAFNAALVHDLARGQDTINIRLDRAAMAGQDPDKASVEDVGAGGLSLSTTEDWGTVFKEINIENSPVQIESGLSGIAVTALLAAHVKKTGQDIATLKGCIAVDPFGELVLTGTLPVSLESAYDEMAALTAWAGKNAPGLRTIAVHAAPYADAGGNAVQEIAFAAATGITYIREMQERGLAINDICRHMQFHFSIGPDFFMEIAKFRAARMVWFSIAEAFGADPEYCKMFIHAATLKYNKTKVDPWVNMLRVSTETFSGIAGGCDSIHIGPFDEVIRKPNEFSRRIARNIHTIFRDEAHFDKVADPAGGSWYVENITLELARKAWSSIQEMEGLGGIAEALKSGVPQKQVAAIAADRAKSTATRKDRIVGTNMYPNLLEKTLEAEAFDREAFKQNRCDTVTAIRKAVDRDACKKALDAVVSAVDSTDGTLMEKALEAALAGAGLGQLTDAFRKNSQGLSIEPLNIHRRAEPFENLRRRTEAHAKAAGGSPEIFMANMGPLARHKPRSDFATAFFHVAAFNTVFNEGFATPDEAADAALASGSRAVVICGTDDDYMDTVPAITQKIKAADPGIFILVAGYSPKYVEQFSEAGVDEFIHLRADALGILTKLQQHLMQPKGESE